MKLSKKTQKALDFEFQKGSNLLVSSSGDPQTGYTYFTSKKIGGKRKKELNIPFEAFEFLRMAKTLILKADALVKNEK